MTTPAKAPRRYLWLAAVPFAVYLVVLHIGIEKGRDAKRQADEGNRVVNVGIQGQAYALDHEGLWPSLNGSHRCFAYEPESLPEGYEIDEPYRGGLEHPIEALLFGHITRHRALTLVPESDPVEYYYLGYAVASEAEGLALIDAVRSGVSLDQDIAAETGKGTLGSSSFYRLRQDLHERLAEAGVTENNSREVLGRFPVIIGRPQGDHSWVFFLDGHAEYLPYPGRFPLTKRFVEALDTAER